MRSWESLPWDIIWGSMRFPAMLWTLAVDVRESKKELIRSDKSKIWKLILCTEDRTRNWTKTTMNVSNSLICEAVSACFSTPFAYQPVMPPKNTRNLKGSKMIKGLGARWSKYHMRQGHVPSGLSHTKGIGAMIANSGPLTRAAHVQTKHERNTCLKMSQLE